MWGVETPMQVGEEIIEMFGVITNSSSERVILKEIREVLGDGIPENGEVVRNFLVRPHFQLGLHYALPPVMRRNGRCVTAAPIPVAGYVLRPGEEVQVATHFRATDLGRFETEGRDIIYEQSGRSYRQRDEVIFTGDVRRRWKRDDIVERGCRIARPLPSGSPAAG